MSKLPDDSALWIRRQPRQNQPFLLWWLQTVLLLLSAAIQSSHNSMLKWNSEKRDQDPTCSALEKQVRVSALQSGLSSQLRTEEISKDSYRKASTCLTESFCCCVYLPAHRQTGEGFAWDKQPREDLQWALDLWPDSTASKTWCNTTLHCSLTFWGWKDTELLFPPFPCPPFPYFWHLAPTFLLFCHQESEAVAKMKTKAVTLVLGLSLLACGHSHLPDSLWHGNQVPLP